MRQFRSVWGWQVKAPLLTDMGESRLLRCSSRSGELLRIICLRLENLTGWDGVGQLRGAMHALSHASRVVKVAEATSNNVESQGCVHFVLCGGGR